MNAPNILTMGRVCAIPFLVVLLSIEWSGPWGYVAALVIFIMSVVTDIADGHIARSHHQVTDFGKFMDPLADKMLVCCVLICFCWMDLIPAWLVIIIVAREFAISGFRAVAAEKNVVIAANVWGKIKSQFQYNAIITILVMLVSEVGMNWEGFYMDVTADIVLFQWFFLIYANLVIWMMVISTVLSLYTYLHDNWGVISGEM